jgi:hypothetical protein
MTRMDAFKVMRASRITVYYYYCHLLDRVKSKTV